jgi:glycosyltransferase involved in cell wall biosynthesis
MKILFDHALPFSLAHGGLQIQIEQTKQALERAGVAVEYLRWWDGGQTGDLIHFFSNARAEYLKLARLRGVPVLMTPLFSQTCNRPTWRLRAQAVVTRVMLGAPLFGRTKEQLNWASYKTCTHLTVGLEAEKDVLMTVYGVAQSRISVVPLGVSEAYLGAAQNKRNGDYLVTIGTITRVKGSVELAKLARKAQVPVLFVGKPYDAADPYWREFQALIDSRYVVYHPHVEKELELIGSLQRARGFVLLSEYENWSLAASEATACGLPLLLRDQKWSRERFGTEVRYFEKSEEANVRILRQFYENAPKLSPPAVKLFSWDEVAQRLRNIYLAVSNSR